MAVAVKAKNVTEAQGAAAISMLEQAAQLQQTLAQASGLGKVIDTTA